ncbi:MAG: PsbP-related protein [Anaerolineae bacterium]
MMAIKERTMQGRLYTLFGAIFIMLMLWTGLKASTLPLQAQPAPRLLELMMATRLDANKAPLEPTDVFSPNDIFYCSALVEEIPGNEPLSARWYFEGQFLGEHTISFPEKFSGYAAFHAGAEKNWPEGDYRVDLYIGPELAGSKAFRVGPMAPPVVMEEYTDNTLGFSLSYPQGWVIEESEGRVIFAKNDWTESFTVMAGLLTEDKNASRFALDLIKSQKESYPALVVISAGDSTLGGQPAYRVNYAYFLGEGRVNSFLVVAVRDGVFFLIDSTNQTLDVFNFMWRTFKFQEEPPVDFRIIRQGVLPVDKNQCNAIPEIHVLVLDEAGNPLNDIRVEASYYPGQPPVELNSGRLGPGFDKATGSGLWTVKVTRDVPPFGENIYTSEESRPLDTSSPAWEDLVAGGYCSADGKCIECGNYSYEVVFQKQ